jgi:hypothetical protein
VADREVTVVANTSTAGGTTVFVETPAPDPGIVTGV